jgi:uncharacterized protein
MCSSSSHKSLETNAASFSKASTKKIQRNSCRAFEKSQSLAMRITPAQKIAIEQAVYQHDPEAQIVLFGSRADDHALGGDIDLMLLSQKITLMHKLSILAQLHRHIGDQKIDILVSKDSHSPLFKRALETGIRL